jgi:hypothetical protein
MSWVAPRDIAEVAALALLNGEWSGRRVQAVHGPEDLTWSQVARILTSELGWDVRVERIADEQMRAHCLQTGIPPAMADAVLGMSTGLRDGFVPEQARSLITTTPTRLQSWTREEFVPLLKNRTGGTSESDGVTLRRGRSSRLHRPWRLTRSAWRTR